MEIPKKVIEKKGSLFGRGPEVIAYLWTCELCKAQHTSLTPDWIEEEGTLICKDECEDPWNRPILSK